MGCEGEGSFFFFFFFLRYIWELGTYLEDSFTDGQLRICKVDCVHDGRVVPHMTDYCWW